jgi:hypothetical protein
VADDDRGRHPGEEAADRRLGRVEVGVRVEPDDATTRVVEPAEDAERDVARSGEHERHGALAHGRAHGGGDALVDGERRARGVAKRDAAVDRHGRAAQPLDEPRGATRPALAVVARHVRDGDQPASRSTTP